MLQQLALAQLLRVGLPGSRPVAPVDYDTYATAPIDAEISEREDDRAANDPIASGVLGASFRSRGSVIRRWERAIAAATPEFSAASNRAFGGIGTSPSSLVKTSWETAMTSRPFSTRGPRHSSGVFAASGRTAVRPRRARSSRRSQSAISGRPLCSFT